MDKALIKERPLAIATYLLSVEPFDYTKPFQSLYVQSQSQLLAAVKHFREMLSGGKYLNKLPQGLTLEEAQAFAKQRLVQQLTDILYFLRPEVKANLIQVLQQAA